MLYSSIPIIWNQTCTFNLNGENSQIPKLLVVALSQDPKPLRCFPGDIECHTHAIPRLHLLYLYQAALAWSPCHAPSADRRFLPQGVQTTPGQMQRISQRRTVLFGQCQAVMGLGLGEGQVSDQWWPFSTDGRDIISGPGEWIGFLRPHL